MAVFRGLGSLAVAAVLLGASFYPAAVSAQDSLLIDCYGFNGVVNANNTKCPNSNACCGPKATCLSNRLCANPGDGPNLWVRGPCAVKGWDPGCAQICKYKEGGPFPRVVPCGDGSLCCNDNPQCCQDGKGVFLDESGNRVSARATAATTSYPPVSDGLSRYTLTPSTSTTSTSTSTSTSSSTTSTTTAASGAAAATTTAATDGTPVPATGSDNSIGLKVGLGLGIPLAVIITAVAVYFLLRRRGRRTDETATPHYQYSEPAAHPPVDYAYSHTEPDAHQPVDYAHSHTPGVVYSGMAKPPPYPPAELMGQGAVELQGSHYGHSRHEML